MYDSSFRSNESSEYELNSDTLDQLYKEQLQMLRELVFKQNRTQDIELCRKWLKIFSKTSKAEKMARNCLCSLMQQQLQEEGTLSEPFTNLQNCNRDLERVLQELDAESYTISANYVQQTKSMRSYCTSHGGQSCRQQHYSEEQQRYNKKREQIHQHQLHCQQFRGRNRGPCIYDNEYDEVENGIACRGSCGAGGDADAAIYLERHANCHCEHELVTTNADNAKDADDDVTTYDEQMLSDKRAGGDDGQLDDLSTECEENEKLTEHLLLRNELEALRLQLTEKEIENIRLKEIAEKYQMENNNYENVLDGIRKNLLAAIKKALQQWKVEVMEVEEQKQDKTGKQQPPGEQPSIPQQQPTARNSNKLLEMIFKDFEGNVEFSKTIKAYDQQFEQIIAKCFADELNKRKTKMARHISRKLIKGKKRIHEKYEQRLRIQNWAQRLQLKLVKLKCFSSLRQSFINAQLTNDGATDVNEKMWEMLRVLEEKYQTIVNEII